MDDHYVVLAAGPDIEWPEVIGPFPTQEQADAALGHLESLNRAGRLRFEVRRVLDLREFEVG